MASWLQARPELNCHKDELKQLSSSEVYLIQVDLGMDYHEDELKQLSSSEVYLIQVHLGMGCHEDELKQLSSSNVVYLIQGRLPHLGSFASSEVVHLGLGCHEDELKHRLSSFEVVYLIRGSSPDYHKDEIKQLSSSEFTSEWVSMRISSSNGVHPKFTSSKGVHLGMGYHEDELNQVYELVEVPKSAHEVPIVKVQG
ncbi:hypothetical protein SLEP1_g46315 [Rubroshorea leprosula]|uniref:Uncharacterized protein n=1 Tax=Rubroshorea leprosula TaxID=152421 RepID=A0AAV5LMQ4_9ROSI|nr:hypothetical protein SLEP1_g46315 [Rubroshorea leprosula]